MVILFPQTLPQFNFATCRASDSGATAHMEPRLGEGERMGRAECLLNPLPTITLVKSVDKLDAGLRSLDHCAQHFLRTF